MMMCNIYLQGMFIIFDSVQQNREQVAKAGHSMPTHHMSSPNFLDFLCFQ